MMAANKVCGNRWDAGAYICPFIHVQWSVLGPCAAAYMTNYIVPLSGGLMPKVVQYSAPIGPHPFDGWVLFGNFGEEVLTYAYKPFADKPSSCILECHIISVVFPTGHK